MKVIVLGASNKEDRYSNMAQHLLAEKGHEPIPVNPSMKEVLGRTCYPDVESAWKAEGPVDTITFYVGRDLSAAMEDTLIKLHPRRFIFNPGAENSSLARRAREADIEVVNDCTLVMLRSGRF